MKEYLINFFKYNDWANRKLLDVIKQLPDADGSVKLFSHFIHAQDKWYNRITKEADDSSFTWMTPVLPIDELEEKWTNSINNWISLIESTSENDLQNDMVFNRANDGKAMAIKLMDLSLQLNYHAIHHRAQVNTLISKQGITPPATDYIFTKLKEL